MTRLNHPGVQLEEYALMHEPDWEAWEEEEEKEREKKLADKKKGSDNDA